MKKYNAKNRSSENLKWILLLVLGCVFSALLVTLIIEKSKYFITISENQRSSKHLNESLIKKPLKPKATLFPTIENKNLPLSEPLAFRKTENLLTNSSFEADPVMAKDKWQKVGAGGRQTVEWSDEQAASGEHALKISAAYPNNGWPGWLGPVMNYKPGSGYELQVQYFTPDGANIWLEFIFYNSENKWLKSFSTGCPQTTIKNKWSETHYKVKAKWIPIETYRVRVGLRQCLNHTKGHVTTLYIDNVYLRYTQ